MSSEWNSNIVAFPIVLRYNNKRQFTFENTKIIIIRKC